MCIYHSSFARRGPYIKQRHKVALETTPPRYREVLSAVLIHSLSREGRRKQLHSLSSPVSDESPVSGTAFGARVAWGLHMIDKADTTVTTPLVLFPKGMPMCIYHSSFARRGPYIKQRHKVALEMAIALHYKNLSGCRQHLLDTGGAERCLDPLLSREGRREAATFAKQVRLNKVAFAYKD
ncbi:hypothetical protein TNCV_198181 [Trichonephila clavipes]|nr:hypothetical protein TNCV_198181 [Trichonephila clavipes]